MSGIHNKSASAKSRRGRIIKVAPMTRAVRIALAASLTALALGASSGAFAANCKAPANVMVPCSATSIDAAPVADLTLVHDAAAPAGHGAFIMPLSISESDVGDVVIDNADPISESSAKYSVAAISGYSSGGSVTITNQLTGSLEASSLGGDATGIEGYAYGDVGIDNAGDIYAAAFAGNAIGIYGYSMTGDVGIDNSGAVTATSSIGLADGIFASGANVDVGNSGALDVEGGTWAAGIEAQGADSVSVNNSGDIYSSADAFSQVEVYDAIAGQYVVVDSAAGGTAFGLYATGGEAGAGVINSGSISVQGGFTTGIEVQSSGDIAVDNSGNITSGSGLGSYYNSYNGYTYFYGTQVANGINATSNGEGAAVGVTNSGDITADGIFGATGIAATSGGEGGSASVSNSGSLYVSQAQKYGYGAYGIVASADGDASIENSGGISVYSAGAANGATALSFAGDASVTNSGDIEVASSAGKYYGATGITAFSANGSASVDNSGSVSAYSATVYGVVTAAIDAQGQTGATVNNSGSLYANGKYTYGVFASSSAGDVSVTNTADGGIDFVSSGYGTGILGLATLGDVSIDNAGTISGYGATQVVGIFGKANSGNVDISNGGAIDSQSYSGTAVGIFAAASYGTASVDNSGSINAYSPYGVAYGVIARGDYAQVSNSGDISANGYYAASGISASSYSGTTVTTTGGSIFAIAVGQADGIDAQSSGGDVMVDNASSIEAVSVVVGAKGINGYAYGNVDIHNSGDIYAGSLYGDAIGIYGYSVTGDTSIGNSGDITAISYYGLADGIFASGANVEVTNSGAIQTYGYTWSAGIEAQGADSTTVTNSGDITALAPGFAQVVDYYGNVVAGAAGAHAFGIYATAGEGGLEIGNSGNIAVDGGYATGIEAQATGDISITNSGDIVAGSGLGSSYDSYTGYTSYYGTQVATGINATSNGEGAAVGVANSGDITAEGIFGATGIAATSGGEGGSASVNNSGSIYVSQNQKYGYGAYGIVVSADADASIDNSGGIDVYSAGVANGAVALSFAGDASVTNSGDISVTSTAALYYGASGIVAFAQNGSAYAGNSGSVSAMGDYNARAVDASGFTGATVVNSGSLFANGKYAYGVYASSGTGDVSVTNTNTGSIEAYSYLGRGFGVLGIATLGDVTVDNAGSIEVYAYGQAAGVFALAQAGDATVTNSGDITAITGGNVAVGIFARADYGTASVDNSGDISVSIEGINGYFGDAAYGIIARGAYADVSNSGNVDVFGLYTGIGIAASSSYGTTVTTSGGSIYVYAPGQATGIDAGSQHGDVTVTNASDITAIGQVYGAIGINAISGYGDTQVANSGDISAASVLGSAIGIYAAGENSSVNNSGSINAIVDGDVARATGIINFATYMGDATTTNSGDIEVLAQGGTAPYGVYESLAVGIYNLAVFYDSAVHNSGSVSATALAMDEPVDLTSFFTAKAIGVQAINASGYGDAVVSNSGTIEATAATTQGFASAWGAAAQGHGLYGDAGISNGGMISSYAYANIGSAVSIGAYATAVSGDLSLVNHGDIVAEAHSVRGVLYYATDYSYATGVKLTSLAYYGAGSATLDNFGSIEATAYSDGGITGARGVQAYGAYTTITNHQGATISATGEVGSFGGGFATGIEAGGVYGIDIVNDGDIEVHGIAHGEADGPITYYAASRAVGIEAKANYQGNVSVTNNGDINAIAVTDNGITFFNAGAGATGVTAYGKYDATVVNAGDIHAIATSDLGIVGAYGVQVHGKYTGNLVNAAGATILAQSSVGSLATDTYGGRAVAFGTHTYGSDHATTTNSGHIIAQAIVTADGGPNDSISLASAWGASIGAYSHSLTGTMINHGDIQVLASADFGAAKSYGTFINSQYVADTSNDGLISSIASAEGGDAFAVGSYSNSLHSVYHVDCDNYGCDYSTATFTPDDGVASLTNSGNIIASASAAGGVGSSYAAVIKGAFGSTLTNSGHITATTEADDAQATGALLVSFYGAASITNSGLIQGMATGDLANATGASAIGLAGTGVSVGNTGQIIAAAYGDDATATALRMKSNSTNKLVNAGTITALGDGERIAISSEGAAKADLLNSGTIIGSIQTGDLDDRFVNASGGKWYPIGSSNFGGGNDVIINSAGALIVMNDSAIHMGTGPANSFLNAGTITVTGDNLIDMGAGNTGAFTNVNWINFINGSTDDKLTVTGNFSGTGALDLDVDLAAKASDQVQVNGNMAANAAQHVDILFDGMPLIAHTSIDFAHVTGTSVAGSFVPGQILSYNYPRNFIDLQFGIGSRINTANTAADVFSIDLDVAGLLDSGTLAASAATGAANMLNDQIGTFRQRMGVSPYGDAGKVMSAFFRTYTNEGDVSPDHVAANFGQGGHFDYDQSTWGREVGVNANLVGNFHAGVVLGTADGRQRLTGDGVGSNRMNGMTWGAYATWFSPQGYYIDLSGRWMAVDIRSTSAAGVMEARAHTKAINLETGYKWTTAGGFNITPQLQYTQTKVEDITAFDGDRADFAGHGGTSSRGRLGVEFSKSFQMSGGMSLTPYASLNAIREFDGEMTYTVADNFHGATSTGGTSSMAELGLGIQKGGFAVTAGANWVDGGAFNSVMGGQVVVRFAW